MDDQTDGITALLNTACFVLHGDVSDELVHTSPIPIITLQAARTARALTDLLRPFAATYIPSVDLFGKHASVTAEALADAGIHLDRECAALRSALYNSENSERSGVACLIFHNRAFAHFFHALSTAANYMQAYTGALTDQVDPWTLDETSPSENHPSP